MVNQGCTASPNSLALLDLGSLRPRTFNKIIDLTEHDPDSGDDDLLEDNPRTESFEFGSAFEKVAEFEKYLDGPNPWDPDFAVKLFLCQIISFR